MKLDPQITALLQQLGYDAATIESLVFSAMLITVMALVTAVPTAIIARRKGRSRALWLLFALSLPVIPLLIVWLLPKLPSATSSSEH
ncbi:MAG: hypothetical protein K9J42_05820 [Sulfuritalea sp.]|nr:hypothetical protein [Sulfuritalea sp.]